MEQRSSAENASVPFLLMLPCDEIAAWETEEHPLLRYDLVFDADDTLWENNIYFERGPSGVRQS